MRDAGIADSGTCPCEAATWAKCPRYHFSGVGGPGFSNTICSSFSAAVSACLVLVMLKLEENGGRRFAGRARRIAGTSFPNASDSGFKAALERSD